MKLNIQDRILRSHYARLFNLKAVVPLAPLLLGSMVALSAQAIAQAETIPNHFLVTQGVLPTPAPPPTNLQQVDAPELLAQTRRRRKPTTRHRRVECVDRCDYQSYVVYIPRYSNQLLEQVQYREPQARKMHYGRKDVVQVGAYRDFWLAERTRVRLRQEGFLAEIGTIRTRRNSLFSVIVSNPDLLELVRKEVRDATFAWDRRISQNVILAGQYNNASTAQALVEELREQGIFAEVVADVSVLDTNLFTNDDSSIEILGDNYQNPLQLVANNNETRANSLPNNYYGIMISGTDGELPLIEAQIRRLAPRLGTERGVYQIDNYREPFVMVGPFTDRKTAERWERYLQDFGIINAQVFSEN